MSVKGIFKILIGTLAGIVLISVIIEYLNVTLTSIELAQMARIAAQQSCELFAQETYKSTDDSKDTGATLKTEDVRAFDGSLYIKGDFYGSDDVETVYNSLYLSPDSPDFENFLSSSAAAKGKWRNIGIMCDAHGISYPGYSIDAADKEIGKIYKETYVTPLNLGVPYMDREVTQKMFRWNLAQLLSNCDRDLIQHDDFKNYCINYKGFRVYADQSYLGDFEYETFDLNNGAELTEFTRLTNIGLAGLKLGSTANMKAADDERMRICIAGINYNVVVAYEGITPIRRVFNWLWTNLDVAGWRGQADRTQMQQWNTETATLKAGGIRGALGTALEDILPIPGKCMYYIVK